MILAALILQTSQAALSPKDFQAKCAEFGNAKNWKGLEGLAQAQIMADPKDAVAQAALGYAMLAENRTDEGRAACEMAIKLNPQLISAYVYLGMSYAQAGDQKGVMSTGDRLVKADPYGAKSYYQAPGLFRAAVGTTDLAVLPEAEPIPHSMRMAYYPASPRRQDGAAVYDITVGPDGKPKAIKPLGGPASLLPAGVLTVQSFLYKPLMVDGKPVAFHAPAVLVIHTKP